MTDLRSQYEAVERAVCAQVPFELSHVPDDIEQRWDAELDQPLATSPPVVQSATAGTPVELKTCQRRRGTATHPGQWVFHRDPHETLQAVDGRYLLAVLEDRTVERWVVCGPTDLQGVLNWHDCPSTPGYDRQAALRWPMVVGEITWGGHGRRARRPDDEGGASP